MIEISTPRLFLRKISEQDKQDMFELVSDEQGCLDDGGYHAFTEMDEEFDALFQQFLNQTRYAIVLAAENKAIGIINVMQEYRAIPTYELGFSINPAYQRQGYAYEAVSSLIATWFEQTDAQMFLAGHFPYNNASKQLIRKLGFTYEGCRHKVVNHAVYGPTDLEYYYLEKQV